MVNNVTDEDLELLQELGVDISPDTSSSQYTQREERIIAGFEDICRFVGENGRLPKYGEGQNIFERLYKIRLDRIIESKECYEILKPHDRHGLLLDNTSINISSLDNTMSDEELLSQLGADDTTEKDVTQLIHVRTRVIVNSAEDVAQRTLCSDFGKLKPIFDSIQTDLKSGARYTFKYKDNAEINKGDLFILDGQKIMVVEMGETFVGEHGRSDCRLRVVFDNGTESDLLLRSLQRALNKDKSSRRISLARSDLGPMFSYNEVEEKDDLPTGYIYVLRSKSDHPFVANNREIIHKIGVTGADVKTRIGNAKKDATYLLADVEIISIYKLANVNRRTLEALIHKVLNNAKLDLEFEDRFGNLVKPKEWFLVPLAVIDEVIEKIKDGTIGEWSYNADIAALEKV